MKRKMVNQAWPADAERLHVVGARILPDIPCSRVRKCTCRVSRFFKLVEAIFIGKGDLRQERGFSAPHGPTAFFEMALFPTLCRKFDVLNPDTPLISRLRTVTFRPRSGTEWER